MAGPFGHQRNLRHSTADRRWASTKRALKHAASAKKTVKAQTHRASATSRPHALKLG